ncbi:MAG TPA: M90 family metallopeptidase [Daejeonella sp.]|nr:M90 family metallopeptidase [Daejeonella sp.]
MILVLVFATAILLLIWIVHRLRVNRKKNGSPDFRIKMKDILNREVVFYQKLNDAEKERFETAVNDFINRVHLEWVGAEANDLDRVLVAASAVIPIFGFGNWRYPNLTNVIIYPDTFNSEFGFSSGDRSILGMVGSGYMNGQMLLSQKSLREGFAAHNQYSHTAIHEFVHLLDKADGTTDGIPYLLLDKPYILPWINLVHQEIREICEGRSDINPYGAINESEFLAVVAEYFFTQPELLHQRHPELYALLKKAFQQSPKTT